MMDLIWEAKPPPAIVEIVEEEEPELHGLEVEKELSAGDLANLMELEMEDLPLPPELSFSEQDRQDEIQMMFYPTDRVKPQPAPGQKTVSERLKKVLGIQ